MRRTSFACRAAHLGLLLLTACIRRPEPGTSGPSASAPTSAAPSLDVSAARSDAAAPGPSSASGDAAAEGSSAGAPSAQGASSASVGERRLDGREAHDAARAAGMKANLFVPNPVTCPSSPKPAADGSVLAAKGKLSGVIVDIGGFLRDDVGIAEAIALLGRPVLCNRSSASRYLDLHLAPRDANVHQVTLETHDDDLIGIVVELEKPVPVDVLDLERRFGKPRRMPGPVDSHEAGSEVFSTKNGAFSAQLMFAHKAHEDPPAARQVHQIIFRRTAMVEILPEGFRSSADLVRLLALALRRRAPDAVAFAGTLGLYAKPVDGRVTYGSALPSRNVARAFAELRTASGRESVRTLSVAFTSPIPTSAESLARDLGGALKAPAPAVTTDGKRRYLDVVDGKTPSAKITLEMAGAGVASVLVERAD